MKYLRGKELAMKYFGFNRLRAGALVLAMTAFATLAHAQGGQQFRVRLQVGAPGASMYFELAKRFGERVERMSGGRIKMEVVPDGAFVPVYQVLDAVDKGVVEAGYGWTHFWSGKHPAAGLFSNPMAGAGVGLDQISHIAWFYEGGGEALYNRLWSDVLKVDVVGFLMHPMGPDPLGWFKRPIKDVADFRKLKYRSPPGITGEIFKEMGVSAVALPGSELLAAAQRGVIDAAEWIGPADDINLGLHTVFKYYYLQGLHQSTDVSEVLFNKTFWNKLPKDLQEIIRGAAMASTTEGLNYHVARNAMALKRLKEEFKIQVLDTPKDFFPEFLRATNVVLARHSAKEPFFKEVLDSQRKFAETVVPYWTKLIDLYSELGNTALRAKK